MQMSKSRSDVGGSVHRLAHWWGGARWGASSPEKTGLCSDPSQNKEERDAVYAISQAHMQEDDVASRRHCAAVERLVAMGLSPQAAHAALRHLDAWLVSEDGKAEMEASEAAVAASGQPILHVGDKVRFVHLKKNSQMNGKSGLICSYRVEDNRWKVVTQDEVVYWVRPKQLEPLEVQSQCAQHLPDSIPQPIESSQLLTDDRQQVLARSVDQLEAEQLTWKTEMEFREINLLEREEQLRKVEEALVAQQQWLEEQQGSLDKRRRCLAVDQAKSMAETDRQGGAQRTSLQFAMTPRVLGMGSLQQTDDAATVSQAYFTTAQTLKPDGGREALGDDEDQDDDDDDEVLAGDMWGMDWCALTAPSPRIGAPSPRVCAVNCAMQNSPVPRLGLFQGQVTPTTIAESTAEDEQTASDASTSSCQSSPRDSTGEARSSADAYPTGEQKLSFVEPRKEFKIPALALHGLKQGQA